MQKCHCCSGKDFQHCCAPFLEHQKTAKTAEQLMRSRFSAYKCRNYQYVFETYGEVQQKTLSTAALEDSARDTFWLGLKVTKFVETTKNSAQVEFIATYAENGNLYQMHEVSDFERQQGLWKYTTGQIQADSGKIKLSRNAPCPCNSGKKFKQCCLAKI